MKIVEKIRQISQKSFVAFTDYRDSNGDATKTDFENSKICLVKLSKGKLLFGMQKLHISSFLYM